MSDPINEIKNTVTELKERIDEVSAEQKLFPKKSWIDVLSLLAPLISGVLIAAVGTVATILYNNQQMHINHIDALDKYRPYVTSENPVERAFGYRAYLDLDEKDFVIELIAAKNDGAGINVLTSIVKQSEDKTSQKAEFAANEIMAAAISIDQNSIPIPILILKNESIKEAWAYLGHYVKSNKKWKTRYFDFGPDIIPDSLIGESLKVREQTGNLNVRVGMPTATGKFLEVVDVLKPGSEAKIGEISEWYTTGYMWAKITYGTKLE